MRVLVNGAAGKMGHATVAAIEADPVIELAGTARRGDDLTQAIKKHQANIVIDFTSSDAVYINCQTIISAGAHPVIGSSGLLPKQVHALEALCAQQSLGGIIAPNFSIGAVMMMHLSQRAAQYFPHAEIIEMHRAEKLDSPSGTAIKTAEMIAEGRETTPLQTHSQEILPHARGANHEHVAIHAMRLPGVIAEQTVTFGGHGETLAITHRSLNRDSFMPGVLMACKAVVSLEKLVYGLEHLLF